MAVYLIYRSAYETPLGRRVVRFEHRTLLAWFQANWAYATEFPENQNEWYDWSYGKAKEVGLEWVYGFGSVFELMVARDGPPKSAKQLKNWLHHKPYPEGVICAEEHALQASTDDDELDLAVMMFDDEFAKKHPDRVKFLLYDKLELPTRVRSVCGRFMWRGSLNDLQPQRRKSGATYAILLVIEDTGWLRDLFGPFRFKGVRLPEWAEFLGSVPDSVIEESEAISAWHAPGKWCRELIELRKLAIEKNCTTMRELLTAYEHTQQRDFASLDQTNRTWQRYRHPSLIQTSKHFAQIAFRETSTLYNGSHSHDRNLQWYFFDDLWGASNSDLAKSLLWFSKEQLSLFRET
jgi:hypothetical protein